MQYLQMRFSQDRHYPVITIALSLSKAILMAYTKDKQTKEE